MLEKVRSRERPGCVSSPGPASSSPPKALSDDALGKQNNELCDRIFELERERRAWMEERTELTSRVTVLRTQAEEAIASRSKLQEETEALRARVAGTAKQDAEQIQSLRSKLARRTRALRIALDLVAELEVGE